MPSAATAAASGNPSVAVRPADVRAPLPDNPKPVGVLGVGGKVVVVDLDAHSRRGWRRRFQGQEAAAVVYWCTSSSPEDAPRGMEFLYDPHRFNVATSRARGAVIVVASPQLFAAECRTPAHEELLNGLCRFRELAAR